MLREAKPLGGLAVSIGAIRFDLRFSLNNQTSKRIDNMSIENNKALVRRYFEDASEHPEIYDKILSPDFRVTAIHHATVNIAGENSGPKAYKAAATWLKTVWKEGHITVNEMIAEDNRVMVRWTFHGIQHGEIFGIPPTGKEVTYSGINIFRIADDKLAESWDLTDRLWLWQQLDVLPDTGEFLATARKLRLDNK
jgi:predicted ester cyclase